MKFERGKDTNKILRIGKYSKPPTMMRCKKTLRVIPASKKPQYTKNRLYKIAQITLDEEVVILYDNMGTTNLHTSVDGHLQKYFEPHWE